MKAILNRILSDANHPGGEDGKKVVFFMKYGLELTGFLKSHEGDGVFLMSAALGKPAMMMNVYLNSDDIAMITVPKPESRISLHSSIGDLRG